jgi:hypothetical protein
MSFVNVLIYIALIVYILYGKAKGWPMKTPKNLFLLPVLVVIIGFGDATHGTMKPFEVALTVVGGAVSLGLGLLRGRADKISIRNASPYVQWGGLSFALFATNLVVKAILDVVGVAAGSTFSAVGNTLVLTLGLTLVGEALALLLRSGATTSLRASDRPVPAQPRHATRDQLADIVPATSPDAYRVNGQQPAPARTADAVDGARPWRPSLRDGAINWLLDQVDSPAKNPETPAPALTDSVRNDRHNHHDRHHSHHGLTGPS